LKKIFFLLRPVVSLVDIGGYDVLTSNNTLYFENEGYKLVKSIGEDDIFAKATLLG